MVASSIQAPGSLKETAASASYMERHYSQVFKKGLSFSGFERDKLFHNQDGRVAFDLSPVSGIDDVGDGRGVAFADFDNDGDSDVFLHNVLGSRHRLFRNNGGQSRSWLRLVLQGTRSNRDGIGAVIEVRSGDRKWVRHVAAGNGFVSTSDRRVLIGLDKATSVDSVEVHWPSGQVDTHLALKARSTCLLIEGQNEHRVLAPGVCDLGGPGDPTGRGDISILHTRPGAKFPHSDVVDLTSRIVFPTETWTVINFWHPTCAPCLVEMPRLDQLNAVHDGRVHVIGVSLSPKDESKDIRRAATKMGVRYPIALVPPELPHLLFKVQEVPIPSTFLIDDAGVIRGFYQGLAGMGALERDLDRLLRTEPNGGH